VQCRLKFFFALLLDTAANCFFSAGRFVTTRIYFGHVMPGEIETVCRRLRSRKLRLEACARIFVPF
jgi:hypothetical protein